MPDGNYARVVRDRPESHVPGEIVHVDGTVVGRHDGIINLRLVSVGVLMLVEPRNVSTLCALIPRRAVFFVGPRSALGSPVFCEACELAGRLR